MAMTKVQGNKTESENLHDKIESLWLGLKTAKSRLGSN